MLNELATKVYDKIPYSEVWYIFDTISEVKAPNDATCEEKLAFYIKTIGIQEITKTRILLANNSLTNKACNICSEKKLAYTCESCNMAYWCSDACKEDDVNHKVWCTLPMSSPRDTGPMRTLLLHVDKKDR